MPVSRDKWFLLQKYGANSHPWNRSPKEMKDEKKRDANQTKNRVTRAFSKHKVTGVQVTTDGHDVYVKVSPTDKGPITSALSKEGLSSKKMGDGTYKVYIPQDLTPKVPDNLKLHEKFRRNAAYSGPTTGDGKEAGLFIPVPRDLAAEFPKNRGGNDKSPPHVTFLYIGKIDKNRVKEACTIIQRSLDFLMRTPVRATLGSPGYFTHMDKNRRVAVCPVQFNSDMATVRDGVWAALSAAGFSVEDHWYTYVPHATLQYLDGLNRPYTGPEPRGSFTVDKIELWGLGTKHVFRIGRTI